MADTSIPNPRLDAILLQLAGANRAPAQDSPGTASEWQPVHTVYGGAHLFTSDVAAKLGAQALKVLDEYAPDPDGLARAFDLDPAMAARIHPRLVEKLAREPVEDFRIDFEDGFGVRPDLEEDQIALAAAGHVAQGLTKGTLPRRIGIRIKSLSEEVKRRSLRTLDLFLTRLLDRTQGRLPSDFANDRRTRTSCARHGACTTQMSGILWLMASIRGGISIRHSCRCAMPPSTLSFSKGSTQPPSVCATLSPGQPRASVVGNVFDDAATGQGLLNYFLRATNCGAIAEADAVDLTGLTLEELRSRSFLAIVNNRRK